MKPLSIKALVLKAGGQRETPGEKIYSYLIRGKIIDPENQVKAFWIRPHPQG